MIGFLQAVLDLINDTINALLGIPIFAAFLGGFVLLAVLGLIIMLREAAGGRPRRN